MIEVKGLRAAGEVWMVDLSIHEGVYRIDRYPVRVDNVPLAPEGWTLEQQQRHMQQFVTESVTRHMRRGSLPPRGTRLDGKDVWTAAVTS